MVKMDVNYAENCWVGNLKASFACLIFLKFSQYCCETSIIQIQQRKNKKKKKINK